MSNEKCDLDALEALLARATPGPWEFRSGNDQNGDSCDLLMAEVGIAEGDEDPEYAEVLFANELGEAEISANWELVRALRNAAPGLIAELREAREQLAKQKREECAHCGERPGGEEGTIWCPECLAWWRQRHADQVLREARAEVEWLRCGLLSCRQGYHNLLEFRRLTCGRYGNLTREEVEEAIGSIDAILAQPAPHAQRHHCGCVVGAGHDPETCACSIAPLVDPPKPAPDAPAREAQRG